MNTFFLCVIKISGYDGPDFVLGVFDSLELAEKAKEEFIKTNQTDDKKLKVLTEQERWIELDAIQINRYVGNNSIADIHYIVSRFSEGFGQIYREINDIIFNNYDEALAKLKLFEKEYDEQESSFSEYFAIEKMYCNQINTKTVAQWLNGDFFGDDDYFL